MPSWLINIAISFGEWLLPKVLSVLEAKYPAIQSVVNLILGILDGASASTGEALISHLNQFPVPEKK